MKKHCLFILLFLYTLTILAQVGINTTNPQQELHIAGTTENVRIEGLNETNNNDNLGMNSSSRVYVNADGDLTLGESINSVELLVDSENYLQDVESSTSIILQTGGGFGYNTAGIPTDGLSANFTLTKNAIIEVNYSVSWSIYKASASPTKRISDERVRIVQMGLYFRENNYLGTAVVNDVDGNPINGGPWCINVNSGGTTCLEVGGMLAINGQFYNNSHGRNGEYENFQNTGSDYVKLGPGTYCVMFAGQLAVYNTTGTGAVRMYFGSGKDNLQVIAHYYN